MAEIENCNFPEDEDIYYDVDSMMWVRFESEDTIVTGLTDVGQFIAGSLLYVKPRKIGFKLERGKRVALIESGKYVGPIKAPLSGELVEVNEKVTSNAKLVNEDPYGEGWIAKIKVTNLNEERDTLLQGERAFTAIKERMASEGWDCKAQKGVQA
jgi:glycine cleavage system H protein